MTVELRDYWLTIRRRWKVVVITLLATVSGALLLTDPGDARSTPRRLSSSSLPPSSDDPGSAYSGNMFATQRVTSIVDFVKTRDLSEVVAANLGGDVAAAEAQQSISASVNPDTSNIVLRAVNPDRVLARDIAQSYAEALSDLAISSSIPDNKTESLVTARIIDNAVVPNQPVSPKPVRNLMLGIVLGLLMGVGLAVLRELLDTSISSSEDVSTVTSAPDPGPREQ